MHKATGVKYAVKIIDKQYIQHAHVEQLQREISILKRIYHPNVYYKFLFVFL